MMSMFIGMNQSLKSLEDHMVGMAISIANLVFADTRSNTWLMDTGATDHIHCNPNILSDITILSNPVHVVFPNGISVLVTHAGLVKFSEIFIYLMFCWCQVFILIFSLCLSGQWTQVVQYFQS